MTIRRQLPRSDEGRDKAITKAKAKNDSIPVANRFLTAPTQTRLNAIYTAIKAALLARAAALANQSTSTGGTTTAHALAKMFISHFLQVFNLGVKRSVYPAAHRAFYQLDVNSDAVPPLGTETEITLWGERLRTGDPLRVAAGGAAMANPAIAEVNAEVAAFNTENDAQSALKDAYDIAQQDVENLRPEGDAVIKKVWDEVETFYNEEEPASKRRKAREWGVVYVSDIKLTFNFMVKNSADNTPVADVVCELDETGNTVNTAADGTAQMQSTIADEATFNFSHPDFVTQQIVLDISTGETTFDIEVALVHV